MDPILGNTPSSLNQVNNRPPATPPAPPKSSDVASDPTVTSDQTGDRIDLSSVSQNLGAMSALPPSGTMPADRLKTVSDRIVTGYYNQPKVADTVAKGVAADLRA